MSAVSTSWTSPRPSKSLASARRSTKGRIGWFGAAFALMVLALSPAAIRADDLEFFETRVRPILVQRCQDCHGPDSQKGGLRLDSKAAILQGGDSGPAAEPTRAEDSLLIEAIRYDSGLQMPPRTKLPDHEIAILERWVAMGMPWPEVEEPAALLARGDFDLAARRAGHWAWRPVITRELPSVQLASWPRGPIDRFILARLEAAGLRPAIDVDRRVLIRRVTFDLIGLPPTPEEVAAFVADPAPDAYERLVDRLLASPHYGERWARHWLDLVRYAETRGHEFDPAIPNAYQYRDYLIRAFNADVPYDRLVQEHIAGDLLPDPRVKPGGGGNESILGTGFWFLGEEVHSPVDIRQDETDRMDNRIDVFGKTFLGLTIACARCHDHKFDAIAQRDYSALVGFLVSSSYRQARFETLAEERRIAERLEDLRARSRRDLMPLADLVRQPVLARLADLLRACRDLIQMDAPDLSDDQRGSAIAEVAQRYDLDPARLARWLPEVVAARREASHPLHAFARLADEPDPSRFDEIRRRLLPEFRRRVDAPEPPTRRIIDYASAGSGAWRTDGFGFGLRPLRPGDVRFAGDPGRPRVEVIDRAAAYRDPAWADLAAAEGTERDHGKLGTWNRSGQTVRTPEFTLDSGRLWYLVKGPFRAYAAVNSHLVIAGPLHGELLLESKGDDAWRWVKHDLAAYRDHRLHVEFSPVGASPMALAAVVDGTEAPPLVEPTDQLALTLLEDPAIDGPEALARAYQTALLDASNRVAANALCGREAEALIPATLARWMASRPDLFERPDETLRAGLANVLARQSELARQIPRVSRTAPVLLDGNGVDEFLLVRGNSRTPSEPVPRRLLEALAGPQPITLDPDTSGRLELARQVASPENPLTARVLVNRLWHHLFGRGIVASVDNLGVLGERPTHPELLDWLADRLVQQGWSIKALIREIVTSRTYRMASRSDEASDRADPDDLLLHRMRVRRLQAEALRDTILAVSGRLDRRAFGPSVPVHLTPFMQGRGRPGQSGPIDGDGRRGVYLEVRRNFLSPLLLAFDAPIPFNSMGRRNVSNVPAQALILLNDPFVIDQAQGWARRVLAEPDRTPEERLAGMYRAAFARDPSPGETAAVLQFLREQARDLGLAPEAWINEPRVWSDVAHVLFNAKEFLFIE